MTTTEFSNEFDVLYNNAMSNQAPGLDEYEKSVFLTKAQDQLVKDYFNNRVDGVGGGFDGSQKRQYDFSGLIKNSQLTAFGKDVPDLIKIDKRSFVYQFPADYFLAVNEMLADSSLQYSVIPLQYNDYQRMMMKPYAFPVKRAAWRLFTNKQPLSQIYYDPVSQISFLTNYKEYPINLNIKATQLRPWDEEFIDVITGEHEKISGNEDIAINTINEKRVITISTYAYSFDSDPETHLPIPTTVTLIIDSIGEQNKVMNISLSLQVGNGSVYPLEEPIEDDKYIEIIKDFYTKYSETRSTWKLSNSDPFVQLLSYVQNFTHLNQDTTGISSTFFFESQYGLTMDVEPTEDLPIAEIIGKFKNNEVPIYTLRYIKKLSPIILDNLDTYGDSLKIRGIAKKTECILPEECHQEILERAVTLAKIAYAGSTESISKAQQRKSND